VQHVIIMVDRANSGTHQVSTVNVGVENLSSLVPAVAQAQAKEMEKNDYAQTKRIYLNRAFGGNRHYCVIDGNLDAGAATGKGAG